VEHHGYPVDPRKMSWHLAATVAFFVADLTIVPRVVKRINKARLNFVAQQSPVGYALAMLFANCAVAGAMDVSLVFAAFLAGFAVVDKKPNGKVSFAFFIPAYFAIVRLKLDLIQGFLSG
jgi:Kef-type K+ transport system membrane component KefB